MRRRRKCLECGERYTTFETAELVMPRMIKRDGSRVPFDHDKLRGGILRALEKRPVAMEDVESFINKIMSFLRSTGEREVSVEVVGEQVMKALKQLDQVAYVRFASVYRSFQDVSEFQQEVARLQETQE